MDAPIMTCWKCAATLRVPTGVFFGQTNVTSIGMVYVGRHDNGWWMIGDLNGGFDYHICDRCLATAGLHYWTAKDRIDEALRELITAIAEKQTLPAVRAQDMLAWLKATDPRPQQEAAAAGLAKAGAVMPGAVVKPMDSFSKKVSAAGFFHAMNAKPVAAGQSVMPSFHLFEVDAYLRSDRCELCGIAFDGQQPEKWHLISLPDVREHYRICPDHKLLDGSAWAIASIELSKRADRIRDERELRQLHGGNT